MEQPQRIYCNKVVENKYFFDNEEVLVFLVLISLNVLGDVTDDGGNCVVTIISASVSHDRDVTTQQM